MTAVREQAPSTSPRAFVRIAWVLHRDALAARRSTERAVVVLEPPVAA